MDRDRDRIIVIVPEFTGLQSALKPLDQWWRGSAPIYRGQGFHTVHVSRLKSVANASIGFHGVLRGARKSSSCYNGELVLEVSCD